MGHALLKAGSAGEAEAVYRADLKSYPRNGWSLFGLMQSLEAQGKDKEAKEVKSRFENMWARSDIILTSSIL